MASLLRLLLLLITSAASFSASTNDFFANRVVLTGTLPTGSGNFTAASSEPNEPHAFNGSLWWEWTPDFEGGVTVTTLGTPVPPAGLVYTGTWPNLTLVSRPAPNIFQQPSRVGFYVLSNVTYYIAAAGQTNITAGNVTVRTAATPPSDDFSRATLITGTNVTSAISVLGSTLQPGESVSNTNIIGTLWWKWTVTNSARFVIHGMVQDLPIYVALYRGDSLTNLTRIAFAAPSTEFSGARTVVDLDPDDYYIALEDPGHYLGATLRIRLAPHNDDFADRVILPSETNVVTSGPFYGATRELNEPGRTNGSIWWQWTAPVSGSYSVDSGAETSLAAVEVFKGTSLADLILVSPLSPAIRTSLTGIRAQAGDTFVIRVTASDSFTGTAPLRIRPGPVNDDFAHATRLEGDSFMIGSTFSGATFEPGEPLPLSSGGGSVWWAWTPTNSGGYSLQARNGLNDVPLFAYRGDSLTNLNLVTNAYGGIRSIYDPATLRLNAGEAIHLQAVGQQFSLALVTLNIQRGPVNDDFSDALLITNELVSGTTRGATFEPGEPLSGDPARGQTVWYRWQPREAQGYDFRLQNPVGVGNVLTLYEGDSFSALTLVRRVQHLSSDPLSVTIPADPTRTYYVAVDSFTAGGDPFTFRIIPGPSNDNFEFRSAISGVDEVIAGSTIGATREPGEPSKGFPETPRTIWYEWTAPSTSGFYVEVSTLEIPPEISIYQGANIASLLPVRSYEDLRPDASGLARWTSFRAVEGGKYAISFGDNLSRTFSFRIRKGPHHDDFANSIPLVLDDAVTDHTIGASLEPNEPTNNIPTGTVWHQFTAPTNGTYVAISDRQVSVYRGTSLTNVTRVDAIAPAFFPFTVPFRAAAGETVFISVIAAFPHSYEIRVVAGAENDNFANRVPIIDTSAIPHPGWSTLEPGEPPYGTNLLSSVWWKWNPAVSGTYRVVAMAAHQGSILGLYTGPNLAELEQISVSAGAFSEENMIDIFAIAGTEYAIVFNHGPVGDNPLTLSIYSPPSNDSFATPQPLTLGQTATNIFTVATLEPGETNSAAETLWYTWTASATDTFAVVPSGDLSHVYSLGIYTGTDITNLVQIAAFDSPPLSPGLAFRAIEGTVYRIVLGLNRATSDRTIGVTIVPGNANDDFAERARLAGLFLSWTNDTFGATSEPGEQLPAGQPDFASSIWAEWTAPQSGAFKIVPQSSYNYLLHFEVYQGTSLTNLIPIASSLAGATFNAQNGTVYFIRISSSAAATLPFVIRLGPVAPNETPATALGLEGTSGTLAGQNWTAQSSVSFGSALGTIWYSWTAPSHGFLSLWTVTNGSPAITAYHTEKPTVSSNVMGQGQFVRLYSNTVAVTEGVDYLFSLTAQPSTNLIFNFDFREHPVSPGSYTNALLGGHDFWSAQTNVVYSGPDALQAGPLKPSQNAWIELVFRGPGTLRYRSKLQGTGGTLSTAISPNNGTFPPNPSIIQHDWTLRTEVLTGTTNVVRWTFTSSGRGDPSSTRAWLDDIEFVPLAPRQPRLSIGRSPTGLLILALQIEANRSTFIDYSSNLVNWLAWTNITSPFNSPRSIHFQRSTNDPAVFFRARVIP